MRSDYVSDGYTASGYIAEVPGLHGELRFRYRPFLVEEDVTLAVATEKLDRSKANRAYVAQVAAKLVEWSLVDADGKAVEISSASVARLSIPLWYRLKSIMLGIGPSDTDPKASDSQADEEAGLLLASIMEGKPIGQAAEEANEKN